MKLIACHIENFGKLSNLSIKFADGINVINESNAWGKSTLAAFLKAMFYGLDAKKDAKAFEKERTLYRPWQGGSFGGEVDFEVEGRSYRVSRSFGRTEKTDEFHLYDLSTNLESEDFSEELGLELFELDSASFKKSIYIAQNDCGSETSDRMNAKLGNLAASSDDINNFEDASRRMKELLNQLTPERVTGSIKKRKNYITQLTQEIRGLESAQEGLDGIKRKEQLVSEQIEELLRIRKDYASALVIASEDSRRKELYAQYDVLCKEVEEKEQARDAFKVIFPVGVPSRQAFEAQMKNVRQMEDAKATIRNQEMTNAEKETWGKLSDMFAEEQPTVERIDAAIAMLSEVDKQKEEIARQESKLSLYATDMEKEVELPKTGSVNHRIFLYLGIGMLLAGGVAFGAYFLKLVPSLNPMILMLASLFAAGIGVVFLALSLVLGHKAKKTRIAWKASVDEEYRELEEKYRGLKEVIASMKEEVRKVYETIREFLGAYHVYCEVKEYQSRLYELKSQLYEYERLQKQYKNLKREQENCDNLRTQVLTFAKEYQVTMGEDMASDLNALQNKATEYQMAAHAYEESVSKKKSFEDRQDKSFWTREMRCPYTIDELNQMIEEADNKIEDLKSARVQYGKQLEELEEQLDLRDEKQAELEEQLELQERDMRNYHLIHVTHDFLQKAKEQFTARYMEPIARGFSKYYQMLTGEDNGEWMIDANINLKVREYGELRDTRWLSAGYQDLIGVCMRLALVDAMYKEEKPFLILDDPFVNLDQEKVNYGNQLLLSVSEEYQVIYFTCHDSRSPI